MTSPSEEGAIEAQLRAFASDPSKSRFDFAPTDQATRHRIHTMAHTKFNLVAVSEGEGNKRHAVVYKMSDMVLVEKHLRSFLEDSSRDRFDLPPAPEHLRYSTRMSARKLGMSAISEGAGSHRHVVVWKRLDEKKIDEQLRQFLNKSDTNEMQFPPAPGALRYFTASVCRDLGLTAISHGDEPERYVVVFKQPPPQYSELKRKQIKALFDSLDVNQTGSLSLVDLKQAMKLQKLPENFAGNLLAAADKDKSGSLDFEEFFQFVNSKDREIRNVFNHLDAEHKGVITAEKLRTALDMLQLQPSRQDFGLLKSLREKYGDKGITYEQFRDFCALLSPTDFGKISDEWIWAGQEVPVSAVGSRQVVRSSASLEEKGSATFFGADYKAAWSGIAGGIANAVSRTCVAPMERVRLQLSVDPQKYPSTMGCFQDIYKREGIRGFWRGNTINVIRIAPQGAIAFLTKDWFDSLLGGKDATPVQRMCSSMLAGMFCMTAVFPLDMIRGRVTTSPGYYKGLGDGLRTVYRQEGFRHLYLGLGPANAWAIPYYGAQFFTYDSLKRLYSNFGQGPNEKPRQIGPTIGLVFGGVSGLVCTTVAYPLELIRRRLQVQGFGGRPVLYSGMLDCTRKIVEKEGVKGLFRGLNANLMKSPLAVAIVFGCYETLMKPFNNDKKAASK